MNKLPEIISKAQVINAIGFSKSTLSNRINDGLFPTPLNLGGRRVGFPLYEYQAVLTAMIAEQSPEEIKALVTDLIKQRKQNIRG